MVILGFLLHLCGAIMLLLFAVRMVRTGIERSFGASLRRMVTDNTASIRLVPMGAVLAIMLQSSAAVTLLVSSFAGNGVIAFAPALGMVIGADIGSAILIQILSFDLGWLQPVLLVMGGLLFLKTERRASRQAGRVILGIAFILLSLDLLRETVDPIREAGFLPAIASYMERDYITAFLTGVTLAFVMQSSVAAVLMCVTVVATGILPLNVGISLVLGCNLGSALIPVWLSRGYPAAARRIPLANLLLRGSAALCALFILNNANMLTGIEALHEAQALIFVHIAFNCSLIVFLPFRRLLEPAMIAILPDGPDTLGALGNPAFRSVLSNPPPASVRQSLAGLRREVLRMAGILNDMFEPVMDLYASPDRDKAREVCEMDEVINSALDGVRRYTATLQSDDLPRDQRKELRALVDYAIAIEAAGDIIVKRLVPLSEEMHLTGQVFSEEGRNELENLHARAMTNLMIAANVLVGSDVESARQLLREKAEMARLERKSRKHHLNRLAQGNPDSLGSSDRHLETAYLLKEFNSWVVSVAHPILDREGQLLKTRLIPDDNAHPATN